MRFEDSQNAMCLCNAIASKSTFAPQTTMVKIAESFGRFFLVKQNDMQLSVINDFGHSCNWPWLLTFSLVKIMDLIPFSDQ